MVHASLDLKIYYLSKKIQDPNVIVASEVHGILAHMIIVSSILEKDPEEVYALIYQIYRNEMKTEEEKKVMIDHIWYELSEYLRVSRTWLKNFGHDSKVFLGCEQRGYWRVQWRTKKTRDESH